MDLSFLVGALIGILIISALTSISVFIIAFIRIRAARKHLRAELKDFHATYGYQPRQRRH